MNDQDRREYLAALRAMQERTAALDELITRSAGDIARVRVALDELTHHRIILDQLIAWTHGSGSPPELTPGAQAIKCKKGRQR
jgi:hypothetical protein